MCASSSNNQRSYYNAELITANFDSPRAKPIPIGNWSECPSLRFNALITTYIDVYFPFVACFIRTFNAWLSYSICSSRYDQGIDHHCQKYFNSVRRYRMTYFVVFVAIV